MLSEVLRRDTLSQAGRARATKAKPQTDVERLLERQSNAVWSLFGDAVFAVLVLSSVAWGLASIGHYKGWWDISAFLGEHYDRDGFCLAHKGTWYESQLLSMYGSVVLALILQIMVRSLAGKRGELLVVDGNAKSIISHGLGHGVLHYLSVTQGGLSQSAWKSTSELGSHVASMAWGARNLIPHRSRSEPLITRDTPWYVAAGLLLSSYGLFTDLLQKKTNFPPWLKTTQAVASALLVPTTVPLIMVFGVTGLIIFFNLHLDKLLHGLDGAKDKYYALYALTQCLSSAAMWAEPYLCDSLLVKYGGHVVFDYSIPLAFIVYLAAASRMAPRKAKAA